MGFWKSIMEALIRRAEPVEPYDAEWYTKKGHVAGPLDNIEFKEEVRNVKVRFELFKGEDLQFYFRLVAPNNRTICQSEGYKRKANALAGIASVKKNAGRAKVEVL